MEGRWIKHLVKAWDAFLDDIFSFVPDESKKHIKNAKKEFLLAIRSMIDSKIQELNKETEEVKKIEIEKE